MQFGQGSNPPCGTLKVSLNGYLLSLILYLVFVSSTLNLYFHFHDLDSIDNIFAFVIKLGLLDDKVGLSSAKLLAAL